jgi:hypothetical protein
MHHPKPCPQPVAELIADSSFYLPGFRLTHILHLVSVADRQVAARVQGHLREQDARVGDIVVVRCRQVDAHRIVLEGIGERRARALREQLLGLDGVLRIRLEHHFVRAAADDELATPATRSRCTTE